MIGVLRKTLLCVVKFKNEMFNLFEKKTKWQVLVTYNEDGVDYIVFARKGIKSGMIYFKTKKVTPPFRYSYNFKSTLFDIKKGFDDVLSA
jgi:hypothetical protein